MKLAAIPITNLNRLQPEQNAIVSKTTDALLGKGPGQWALRTHTHKEYLLKKSKYTFYGTELSNKTVEDIALKEHTHPQYIPKSYSNPQTTQLISGNTFYKPDDFSPLKHNHDERYYFADEVVDNAVGLYDSASQSVIGSAKISPADHKHPQYLQAWDETSGKAGDEITAILTTQIAPNTSWLAVNGERYSADDFATFIHTHGKLYVTFKDIYNHQLVNKPQLTEDGLFQFGNIGSTDKLKLYYLGNLGGPNYLPDYTSQESDTCSTYISKTKAVQILTSDMSYIQSYVGDDFPENYVPEIVFSLKGSAPSYDLDWTLQKVDGYVMVGHATNIVELPIAGQQPVVIPLNRSVELNTMSSIPYGIIYSTNKVTNANGDTETHTVISIVGFPDPNGNQQVIKFSLLIFFPAT